MILTLGVGVSFFSLFFVNNVLAYTHSDFRAYILNTDPYYSTSTAIGIYVFNQSGIGIETNSADTDSFWLQTSYKSYFATGTVHYILTYDPNEGWDTICDNGVVCINGTDEQRNISHFKNSTGYSGEEIQAIWGGVGVGWVDEYAGYSFSTTSSITLTSPTLQTFVSNPITFGGTYTNADTYTQIEYDIYNTSIDYQADIPNRDIPLANGVFSFSHNLVMPYVGNYRARARLVDTSSSTNYIYTSWSSYKYYGLATTSISNASTTQELAYARASTTLRIYNLTGYTDGISTTDSYNTGACNPFKSQFPYFNLEFSASECVRALFVPNEHDQAKLFLDTKNVVLRSFPIGYITDFVEIISTSSSSSLPILSATVPSNLPGGGNSISLDPNNVLDMVLYASSSVFSGDTETLYDFTSYYWNILCYLGLGLYFFNRIMNLNKKHYAH